MAGVRTLVGARNFCSSISVQTLQLSPQQVPELLSSGRVKALNTHSHVRPGLRMIRATHLPICATHGILKGDLYLYLQDYNMRVWIPKINIFALNSNQFLKLKVIQTFGAALWTDSQHAASLYLPRITRIHKNNAQIHTEWEGIPISQMTISELK